jgi:hypothetical protein
LPCQIAAGKGLFAPIHPSYNPDNERNQNTNNDCKHDRPHSQLALVTRQPWKQDFAQFFHKLQAMLATQIGFSDWTAVGEFQSIFLHETQDQSQLMLAERGMRNLEGIGACDKQLLPMTKPAVFFPSLVHEGAADTPNDGCATLPADFFAMRRVVRLK